MSERLADQQHRIKEAMSAASSEELLRIQQRFLTVYGLAAAKLEREESRTQEMCNMVNRTREEMDAARYLVDHAADCLLKRAKELHLSRNGD